MNSMYVTPCHSILQLPQRVETLRHSILQLLQRVETLRHSILQLLQRVDLLVPGEVLVTGAVLGTSGCSRCSLAVSGFNFHHQLDDISL
jgi:hypothetical protein